MRVGDLAATDVQTVDADLAADGAADRLIITGTGDADQIAITGSAGSAHITGLAAAVNVAPAEPLDNLVINALAGDDVVEASGLQAGVLGLTINDGPGEDAVIQN